jgi:hypothetical protein
MKTVIEMKVWNDWAWVKVSVLTCLPGLLIVAYKLAIDYGTQKKRFQEMGANR